MTVAESEASLIPFETRLLKHQLSAWIKWHSKPDHHRFWIIKRTICLTNKRYISPLQRIAENFKDLDLASLEKIEAFSKAPWVPAATVIMCSRETAIKKGTNIDHLTPVAFTDGSARNNLLAIGVHWIGALQWPAVSRTISSPKILDPHAAELAAIDCAVSQLLYSVQQGSIRPPITIFSDSLGALQALRNPRPKSGQFLVTQITLKIHEINISNQTSVTLEWSPGHSHIPGNEMAHNLAQLATRKEATVSFSTSYPTLQSLVLENGRKMFLPPPSPWIKPQLGRFTHSLDKALPGKHTLVLYNGKPHIEAATLCQLRSGMCSSTSTSQELALLRQTSAAAGANQSPWTTFCLGAHYGPTRDKTFAKWQANSIGGVTYLLRSEGGQEKRKMGTGQSGNHPLRWSQLPPSSL